MNTLILSTFIPKIVAASLELPIAYIYLPVLVFFTKNNTSSNTIIQKINGIGTIPRLPLPKN